MNRAPVIGDPLFGGLRHVSENQLAARQFAPPAKLTPSGCAGAVLST